MRVRWPGNQHEKEVHKVKQRKLVAYKRQDQVKGLGFNLKVADIQKLKQQQNNNCAACGIGMLWTYASKDTQQFSVDRLDNTRGHIRVNIRLTCLECNRKRCAAPLYPVRRQLSIIRNNQKLFSNKSLSGATN